MRNSRQATDHSTGSVRMRTTPTDIVLPGGTREAPHRIEADRDPWEAEKETAESVRLGGRN